MKAVIQRVRWAEVYVDGRIIGRVERGLLVYVGVAAGDTAKEAAKLADKVAHLRIFEDEAGKLNRSVQDARGGVLAISNFTLLADARKARRQRPAAGGVNPRVSGPLRGQAYNHRDPRTRRVRGAGLSYGAPTGRPFGTNFGLCSA
jgi:D-aminoacyl-tRNA deacylase